MAEAKTGEEALARVESFKPDLVILDIIMPEMDGLTVSANLRKQDHISVRRISDTGKPMSLYIPGFLDFDPNDISTIPDNGRGLYIIQSVMDELSYDSYPDKNVLTMKKTFYRS